MGEFRSGFISIVGRPNVGKSTFLNQVLGQKIAIMSDKPQTTRNAIRGVYHSEEAQIIFIDTPGINKPRHELGQMMLNAAVQHLRGVDAVLFMVNATEPPQAGERDIIERLKQVKVPVFLVINKIDLLKNELAIEGIVSQYKTMHDFTGYYAISALTMNRVDALLKAIVRILPEGPAYYPEGQISDQPERFLMAELIREKVLHLTHEEIPHSVAVVIESFQPDETRTDIFIMHATIYVERESQKGIIIGKKGEMLKQVGTAARHEIQSLLGNKVHMELWVKTKKDWRKKKGDLRHLGYREDQF